MKKILYSLLLLIGLNAFAVANDKITISVDFPASIGGEQDGRLMVMLANNDNSEPRFQINPGPKWAAYFWKGCCRLETGYGNDN